MNAWLREYGVDEKLKESQQGESRGMKLPYETRHLLSYHFYYFQQNLIFLLIAYWIRSLIILPIIIFVNIF